MGYAARPRGPSIVLTSGVRTWEPERRNGAITRFFERLAARRANPRPRPGAAALLRWRRLKPAEHLLADLSHAVDQEMVLLDDEGVIVAANAAWRAALPPTLPACGVGDPYVEVCRRLAAPLDSALFRVGVADVLSGREASFSHRYVAAPFGCPRREIRITPMTLGSARLFVVVHEDVRLSGEALASAGDLLAAQEEERQRIAMELHDSTSQHLVAIAMGLARLRRIVGGDATEDLLEDMSHSIGEVVREIRVVSYLMRPAGSEDEDLGGSIRAFVKGFAARTGLRTSVVSRGDLGEGSPGVRHAVYRIVQEALANVYRHARATEVSIELSASEGALSLRIADDGRGISALLAGDPSGFQPGVGLAGMRTRAAQLGGRLEIGCPGRGVEIHVELPLQAACDA